MNRLKKKKLPGKTRTPDESEALLEMNRKRWKDLYEISVRETRDLFKVERELFKLGERKGVCWRFRLPVTPGWYSRLLYAIRSRHLLYCGASSRVIWSSPISDDKRAFFQTRRQARNRI